MPAALAEVDAGGTRALAELVLVAMNSAGLQPFASPWALRRAGRASWEVCYRRDVLRDQLPGGALRFGAALAFMRSRDLPVSFLRAIPEPHAIFDILSLIPRDPAGDLSALHAAMDWGVRLALWRAAAERARLRELRGERRREGFDRKVRGDVVSRCIASLVERLGADAGPASIRRELQALADAGNEDSPAFAAFLCSASAQFGRAGEVLTPKDVERKIARRLAALRRAGCHGGVMFARG